MQQSSPMGATTTKEFPIVAMTKAKTSSPTGPDGDIKSVVAPDGGNDKQNASPIGDNISKKTKEKKAPTLLESRNTNGRGARRNYSNRARKKSDFFKDFFFEFFVWTAKKNRLATDGKD